MAAAAGEPIRYGEFAKMKFIGIPKFTGIFILVLIVLLCTLIYYWRNPWLRSEYQLGQQVIDKIEQFKTENRRLPESMNEIEPKYYTEEGPIYYQKLSASHYIIWFGLSLGESYTYDSENKRWQ